jgi:hypothetical protein
MYILFVGARKYVYQEYVLPKQFVFPYVNISYQYSIHVTGWRTVKPASYVSTNKDARWSQFTDYGKDITELTISEPENWYVSGTRNVSVSTGLNHWWLCANNKLDNSSLY